MVIVVIYKLINFCVYLFAIWKAIRSACENITLIYQCHHLCHHIYVFSASWAKVCESSGLKMSWSWGGWWMISGKRGGREIPIILNSTVSTTTCEHTWLLTQCCSKVCRPTLGDALNCGPIRDCDRQCKYTWTSGWAGGGGVMEEWELREGVGGK